MNSINTKIEIADVKLQIEWAKNKILSNDLPTSETEQYRNTHIHATFELFFIKNGELNVITHNNKLQCRNSIVIVPPQLYHCTVSNNAEIGVINFKIKQGQKDGCTSIFKRIEKQLSSTVTVLPLDETVYFYLTQLNDLQGDKFLSEERSTKLLFLIFSEIFSKLCETPLLYKGEKHQDYVQKIENYLSAHYAEKLLILDLAKLLYLSTKQVSRIIKKEFNCTFPSLVNTHRLGVAKMLLLRSDIEVNKIAQMVGFEYSTNFYNNFKKTYGVSPNEYRKIGEN